MNTEDKVPEVLEKAESGESNEAVGGRRISTLLDHTYDGTLPITLFCAIVGMLLGTLPGALGVLASGKVLYPLFAAVPAVIYLLTILLKAGRDVRALIAMSVFSLAGAYLTALSCQAVLYVQVYNMSVMSIPLVTILAIGKSGILPASASAYTYPLLFTALGVILAWELMYYKKTPEALG